MQNGKSHSISRVFYRLILKKPQSSPVAEFAATFPNVVPPKTRTFQTVRWLRSFGKLKS